MKVTPTDKTVQRAKFPALILQIESQPRLRYDV